MRDNLADMLTNLGPTSDRQFFFQKSFLNSSQQVGAPYADMPKAFREQLDSFAISVLDPHGGKVIVTGNTAVGKSYLINQLYYNRHVFMDRAKLRHLEFVDVPLEHANLVSQNASGRWMEYVELAMNIHDLHLRDIVFVTESIDAAIGITSLGGRVVLEAAPQTLHHLHQHESAGVVKQWGSWEIIDLNEAFLDKTSLIEILALSHLGSLNEMYPEIELTRKHVALLVDYCVKEGELYIDESMETEWSGKVMVQPGIMAKILFRFASTLAFDNDMRNSKGKLMYGKAIRDTFKNFEPMLFQAFHNFVEMVDQSDFDPRAEAIRDFIQTNLPGVQVTQIMGLNQQSSKTFESSDNSTKDFEFSDFSTLKDRLKSVVFGQDTAIDALVNGLKISAAGLNMDTKPLRSLLFLGPTGVGKTELSLTLAKELMTEPLPVKRIDMSEFGSSHESSKLLGAPPGYVGHEAGGVLTNFVKDNPNSLIILDEIEKAHEKVWDSFLQILDAGRMTDSKGETVDFTKTVIIMTSNLGADKLKNGSMGFITSTHEEAYLSRVADADKIIRKEVEKEFRPEMVNRFDQLIVFNELPKSILHKVIAKELDIASDKLTSRGYLLEKPKVDILDHIAGLSNVTKYGAREVQRIVGTNVLELLAEQILSNDSKKTLTLRLKDGNLLVKSKASKDNGELNT